MGEVGRDVVRGRPWAADGHKAWVSLGANLLVWGFVVVVLNFTHVHIPMTGRPYIVDLSAPGPAILIIFIGWLAFRMLREPLSRLSHRFLRLPLRTGLFPNFERIRFLRARIPEEGLRASQIRVIMTPTPLNHGVARFFSPTPVDVLPSDPPAQAPFV